MKNQIEFAQFLEVEANLEITVGTVVHVEEVPKSKLLKLTINVGGPEPRTCLTNIREHLDSPADLEGKTFAFITNLKPVEMKGITSNAMIMPGTEFGKSTRQLATVNAAPGTRLI
jgi:methionyl-tRNA synthetase